LDRPVPGPYSIGRRKGKSLGTTLHESFAASLSGGWVDRDVWAYCRVGKEWLDDQGVTGIAVEAPLESLKRHGVCDVIGVAGNDCCFIVDWKYAVELPTKPLPRNVFQLGLYASLAKTPDRTSGALAYVSPRERKFRIFSWASLSNCAAEAERLAA
jgi:hypothetical protein